MTLYDEIKGLLVKRGWKIDETAQETCTGELHEFIHPETGRRRAWIDALLDEQSREPS